MNQHLDVSKYNAFFLGLFIFNGLFNMLSLLLGYESVINYVFYAILFILFCFINFSIKIEKEIWTLYLLYTILFLVLIGYFLSQKSTISSPDDGMFLIYIFVYTIIPLCILSVNFNEKYFHKVIRFFIPINTLVILFITIYRQDLFLFNKISYMSIGMWLSPCLLFAFYYFYIDKIRSMAIWFIISSVIIFTSANRFILVVSLISVISIYLSNIKLSRGFLFNVTIFSVLSIIFSLNIISILNYLLDSMSYFGIYSMGLQRLLDSLNAFSNGDSVISGRGLFYLDTLSLIMSNPFGLGPINGNNLLSLSMERSYDSVMLAYPHNFFLELYLHYGIFGGTFVLIIIGMIALYNVKYRERIGSKFYLYLMMSCLSISLLTSSSYLFFSPFWISLALGLNNINKVLKT